MTEKELRKLNRRDLLEMLIIQAKRTEELQTKLDESKHQLENKEKTVQNSKPLEDADLKLNDIFEATDIAAEQYIKSVSSGDVTLMTASQADYARESEELLSDAKKSAQEIVNAAQRTAQELIGNAQRTAQEITEEAEKRAAALTAETEEKCKAREDKATRYVDTVNAKIKQLYGDYKELFLTLQGVLKETNSGEKK